MKKRTCLLFLSLLFLLSISCKQEQKTVTNDKKKTIVVTIYPIKLILQEIVGDDYNIITILPPGASPHNYEPKPSDISLLQDAEIFFYISDDLDNWITKFINNDKTKKIKLIDFVIPIIMSDTNFSHNNVTEACNHNLHCSDSNINPHFWTSPMLVKNILQNICNSIIVLDKTNENTFNVKTIKFGKKLDDLHIELTNELNKIKNKKIFTYHNSFQYFIQEFNLNYGGIIEESPGKEEGPVYMKQLIDKIKESKVKAVFSERQLYSKIMETIAKETNVKILELDPIAGNDSSLDYCSFIKSNTSKIIQGLK